jgi:hypothetical protein
VKSEGRATGVVHRVVAAAGLDAVVAGTGENAVGAVAAGDRVVAGAGDDGVAAVAGADGVVAGAGLDRVVAVAGQHEVVAASGDDGVVAVAGLDVDVDGHRVVDGHPVGEFAADDPDRPDLLRVDRERGVVSPADEAIAVKADGQFVGGGGVAADDEDAVFHADGGEHASAFEGFQALGATVEAGAAVLVAAAVAGDGDGTIAAIDAGSAVASGAPVEADHAGNRLAQHVAPRRRRRGIGACGRRGGGTRVDRRNARRRQRRITRGTHRERSNGHALGIESGTARMWFGSGKLVGFPLLKVRGMRTNRQDRTSLTSGKRAGPSVVGRRG